MLRRVALAEPIGVQNMLWGCLTRAELERWSGHILVRLRGEVVGEVVIHEGKIAWAVARNQSEHLGTFLLRLGQITPEQLAQVHRQYSKHNGRKHVSLLLDEARILPREVLRRCVMLHVKLAVASLLAHTDVLVDPSPGAIGADANSLFDPVEVLPPSVVPAYAAERARIAGAPPPPVERGAACVIAPIVDLPGYLASAIVSSEGAVLMCHGSAQLEVDPATLGVFAAELFESSLKLALQANLGLVNAVVLECAKGLLAARWTGDEQAYLALLLTTHESKLGMLTTRVRRLAEAFQSEFTSLSTGAGAIQR
jgi:predicted regulator of Ras-like GTPase activity (Roadblock/LC7/MglB family)